MQPIHTLWWSLLLSLTAPASLALNFKLHGLDYSLRIGPDWEIHANRCKTLSNAIDDMTQLATVTDNIRIFSLTDCNAGDILLQATQQVGGLGLWLGLWVGPNGTNFAEEQAELLNLIQNRDVSNVVGIHVSSEAIYRGELTVAEAIALRNDIKADMDNNGLSQVPVTIADIVDNYIQYPELVTVDDQVVHFNQFPFWSLATNINDAAPFFLSRVNALQNVGGRQIVIGETGWAGDGVNANANPANEPSMQKWLRDFVCLAQDQNWAYYWFIAYDSDWQRVNANDLDDVEGHFGLFTQDGTLKPFFQNFDINCTEPAVDLVDPATVTFAPQQPSLPSSLPPSSTPTRSVVPSMAPSRVPSSSPTASPPTDTTPTSMHPSDPPSQTPSTTSMEPSWTPSASPSSTPSRSMTPSVRGPTTSHPSTVPSGAPSGRPTVEESSLDDNRSDAPSSSDMPSLRPSSRPSTTTTTITTTTEPETTTPTTVTAIQNLELMLLGVSSMDATAVEQFVNTTKEWYLSMYQTPGSSTRRRTRRRLENATTTNTTFLEFDTDIVVRSQDVTDVGNRVTYDQVVSFREEATTSSDPTSPRDLVLNPFDNATLRSNYYSLLRNAGPTFQTVADSGTAPDGTAVPLTNTESTTDDGGGSKKLVIVGVLCAVAGVLMIAILYLVLRRRASLGRGKHVWIGPDYHDNKDDDELYGDEIVVEPRERPTSEFSWSLPRESEVSDLQNPSLYEYSREAEYSTSTSK